MKLKLLSVLLTPFFLSAQMTYNFDKVYDIETTAVKNQGNSGTCWSFSTSSFLENEIYRLNKKWVDVSEMYFVKNVYQDKAYNYVYRQGNAQFSEGGLAHDVINMVEKYGIVPQENFTGNAEDGKYNHEVAFPNLKKYLDNLIKNPKTITPNWSSTFLNKLDSVLGKSPLEFQYEDQTFTAKSFAEQLKINTKNYITITSFSNLPYYQFTTLSIPDNYSNGKSFNVPLNEYMTVINDALKKGYTLALDADVSENYFSKQYGLAIVPENVEDPNLFVAIVPEKNITEQVRLNAFLTFETQDDHLMHIVGLYKDHNGTKYYKVKNSWGNTNIGNNGYIMMSENYMRYKSISVLLHKDGLSYKTKSQLSKIECKPFDI